MNGILVGEATWRATRHVDRLRRGRSGRGEGEIAAGPGLGSRERPLAPRHRRRPVAANGDGWPRAGACSSSRTRSPDARREKHRAARHARRRSRHRQEPARRRTHGAARRLAGALLVAAGPLALVRGDAAACGRWERSSSLTPASSTPTTSRPCTASSTRCSPNSSSTATSERWVAEQPPRARRDRGRTDDWSDRRLEAFAAWRRLFEAMAEQRPLVLVFEDLHWADDTLLDFVDHLAEWVSDVPLLIVATARPELLDRRPDWGGGKRNATTLSISPLSEVETATLIASLLDRAVLDAETQQAVLVRAEGNPLYAAEYARMLADHEGEDLPLPETVQGLIAARIDGLRPRGEGAAAKRGRASARSFGRARSRGATRESCSTRSGGGSSSGATAAPPSPARRSTPSSTSSCATSPTGRSRGRGGWRSIARPQNGSRDSPTIGARTAPRCSHTTTARRCGWPKRRRRRRAAPRAGAPRLHTGGESARTGLERIRGSDRAKAERRWR